MRRAIGSWGFVFLLSWISARPVDGQTAAAAAAALFQQGKAYMEDHDYAAACLKFEESYRLDATKQGTLFSLALCRDKEEKIATAVTHYRAYLRAYEGMPEGQRRAHEERATVAGTRVKELETEVPTIAFVWSQSSPPTFIFTVDGIEFGPASLNSALPFDPGKHVIVTKRKGKPDAKREVELQRGSQPVIDLSAPPIEAKPPNTEETPKTPVIPRRVETAVKPRPAEPPSPSWPVVRNVTIGLGAGALLALGAGTFLGLRAMESMKTVDARCDGAACVDLAGKNAGDEVKLYGNLSTAAFVVGGALTAGAIVVPLVYRSSSARKPREAAARVVISSGGLVEVRGEF